MKLAASLFFAALSVGCADEVSTGGGQGEGIKPSKTYSFETVKEQETLLDFEPAEIEQVGPVGAADHICTGCEMAAYSVVPGDNGLRIDEVWLVRDDHGVQMCSTYLHRDAVVYSDCPSASR